MSAPDTAVLQHVGPGTPMGELMREYWIPALMSCELAADGDPLRLMLLGERLVAFRDTAGRVGIFDHRCPHRCASLFLGRNEAHGLRCVYHGWKFDVTGACVDMPNAPADQDFKHKVRARAYPTAERNGVVWVYMGPREQPPGLPQIEATLLPLEEISLNCKQREANWLQVMEGDLDTGHFGFLHLGGVDPADLAEDNPLRDNTLERAVRLKVGEAPWGTRYAAFRPEGGATCWRFANFLFPFWTQVPQGHFDSYVAAGALVPMDDTHTMVFRFTWKRQRPYLDLKDKAGAPVADFADHPFMPTTTDWCGRWRPAANEANDWMIDRQVQRHGGSFTGIRNLFVQDQAAVESPGPIVDHGFEHLGPTDQMITRTRRRLVRAVLAHQAGEGAPPGVDDPAVFLEARSGQVLAAAGVDWEDAYDAGLKAAQRPGLALSDAAE